MSVDRNKLRWSLLRKPWNFSQKTGYRGLKTSWGGHRFTNHGTSHNTTKVSRWALSLGPTSFFTSFQSDHHSHDTTGSRGLKTSWGGPHCTSHKTSYDKPDTEGFVQSSKSRWGKWGLPHPFLHKLSISPPFSQLTGSRGLKTSWGGPHCTSHKTSYDKPNTEGFVQSSNSRWGKRGLPHPFSHKLSIWAPCLWTETSWVGPRCTNHRTSRNRLATES